MASRWPARTVIAPSESGPVTETTPSFMRRSSCSPDASQETVKVVPTPPAKDTTVRFNEIRLYS